MAIQFFHFSRPSPEQKPTEAAPKVDSDATKPSMTKQKLDDLRTKLSESQYNSKKVKENIRGYVFTRFMDYVKNYGRAVEKKYPVAFKVYRMFLDGVTSFYHDMKDYLKISAKLIGRQENIRKLTRRELEIYYQLPRDMRKVGPLLLVSSIPFAQYLTMPVAYVKLTAVHLLWRLN